MPKKLKKRSRPWWKGEKFEDERKAKLEAEKENAKRSRKKKAQKEMRKGKTGSRRGNASQTQRNG